MAGESKEVGKSYIEKIPIDLIPTLCKGLPEHTTVCTLSRVSTFFRRAVHQKVIPQLISSFNLNEPLSDPIFEQHPIDFFKLYHVCKPCLPELSSRLTEAWCLATFAGNKPALDALLGEDIMTTRDEAGAGVVHFLALGGHTKWLLELALIHGIKILHQLDGLGNSVLHYAALGMNIKLIKKLIVDFKVDSTQKTLLFNLEWSDGLTNRTISEKNALVLLDLVIDKEVYEEARNILSISCQFSDQLPFTRKPDFSADYDITNEAHLNELIVNVVRKIVTDSQTQYTEYLSCLAAYRSVITIAEPQSFIQIKL